VSLERARVPDAAPSVARQSRGSPLASLQRAAGNRATARLLARQPSNASRLAKVAKQLNIDVDERDIHFALRVRDGEDDGVRPGLNIVAKLGARGRTGFVDAGGRYRGDFVPATRDRALPAVAIMLGPVPFQEGDASLLATLRHELVHAEHDRILLGWLTKWCAADHGDFLSWLRRQKASPVDLALANAAALRNPLDTELLAHIEGFAAVFGQTPPPSAPVVLRPTLPPAIEQLRGAAERGWTGVDDAVKSAAWERLVSVYRGLDSPRQVLLRDWLFYLRYRATTPWPKNATDEDAKAARLVWHMFRPHVPFLDWMLGAIVSVESAGHPLRRPAERHAVTVPLARSPTASGPSAGAPGRIFPPIASSMR
jgi:hypothetical protein